MEANLKYYQKELKKLAKKIKNSEKAMNNS